MKIPDETEETSLNHTTHLLQALLDATPRAHHFKSKWSSIAAKLTSLSSHLSSLSSPTTSTPTNPLSLDLLRSLSLTLSSALSLLTPCLSPSPLPSGKLKTQNDVDSISARLDRHLNDLHVLLKSGVLHDDAVSVSPSSKRDSTRAEARNLITRLQIGTVESKNSAMDSLLTLLQEDDKNVLIAVAQGVVPVLVRLLDCSSSFEVKEKTVNAISRVSAVDSSKHVLIAEGLVLLNNLLRVVESGSGVAREKACIALKALTHSRENARAIGSRGGISSLLAICEAGTPSSQAAAARVLRDLSLFDEVKENFIEENALRILLTLLASGTSLAQENAIGCLCNLVKDDFQLKLLVAREGGIDSLKSYWDSVSNVKSLEVAVELALSNLMGFAGNRSIFRKEERGIVVAVQLLDPLTRNLDRKYPVSLLASLVHSKNCRKQMIAAGACGFLQKLVEMDVEGAKKLLESLGKGKIWGVFARP
ncbi:hypothetical protein RHSIM_Rhsim12G0178700 [Rhododendron simsii]|uniref:DUF7032 domain-containing protein n=1 Tax=Rhododendron simsii TaxID=118357 RepID=A0A834G3E9_RHOSS|nr:hypothetical protein RHSIM_Rhsim12G0178700 [Rhododendron simsii]